ncbi:uncharacterized protein LOC110986782 isoform X2 [Acanthaster planci]|uniref:Uncharacterized protein LOC110986782 isoform X2 n=1 Tax=Acanthaster planci TaxID=133434 RepID=A0A8B7ZG84_ACAPL|nr:uncharacterized protein LOC110986782 isoform X2 [Acanthaster planci]
MYITLTTSPQPESEMTTASTSPPPAEELERTVEQSGLILTKKNIADEESFVVELQEVFNVGYLTLHPLFALPVCWASAKIRPAPNRPLNSDLFDKPDEVLDITTVVAFPKEAKKLQMPAQLDVFRCSRITLPPKKLGGSNEDALLIYSYKPQENNNKTANDVIDK